MPMNCYLVETIGRHTKLVRPVTHTLSRSCSNVKLQMVTHTNRKIPCSYYLVSRESSRDQDPENLSVVIIRQIFDHNFFKLF